jgi:hypothetical protein
MQRTDNTTVGLTWFKERENNGKQSTTYKYKDRPIQTSLKFESGKCICSIVFWYFQVSRDL